LVRINKQFFVVAWVIAFLIFVPRVYAEKQHPIDNELTMCMDKSKGITAEMVKCGDEAYKKWDSELNRYYGLLMKVLGDDAKKKLKESQIAWLKFRDLEFDFIPQYFTDPGSYQGPAIAEHKMDIVKARTLELKSYYDTIMAGK
jgi:uncharacterized protein YecT (DUF1311 family)